MNATAVQEGPNTSCFNSQPQQTVWVHYVVSFPFYEQPRTMHSHAAISNLQVQLSRHLTFIQKTSTIAGMPLQRHNGAGTCAGKQQELVAKSTLLLPAHSGTATNSMHQTMLGCRMAAWQYTECSLHPIVPPTPKESRLEQLG